jgi:hypothetical protein
MRLEQLIEIGGWLGGERGTERHDNGEYPHLRTALSRQALIRRRFWEQDIHRLGLVPCAIWPEIVTLLRET